MNSLEFRLYYDDNGKVLFYTCDKPEGNYLVIDSKTYLSCRFDIKIVDGKIHSIYDKSIITKLVPDTEGTSCHPNDISIIYEGSNSKKWRLNIDECN